MSRQAQNRIPLTYINIRRIIGIVAMCLPVIVFLTDKVIFQRDLQTSISAYYYTEMRWYFVLTLFCIGFFLFYYQGYAQRDNVLAKIAGTAAFLTAIFPTEPTRLEYCASPLSFFLPPEDLLVGKWACSLTAYIHLASAVTMFLTVAYFSWSRFTLDEPDSEEKDIRKYIYKFFGGVIFAMIAIMAAASIADLFMTKTDPWKPILKYVVYWGEFISLVAFGITWAVKGEMIWKDAISSTTGRDFNKLQNRQYLAYKSGLSYFVFLVAIWFTVLLFAAETAPFNIFAKPAGTEAAPASAAEGAEPSAIQVIDNEPLGQLCYPEEIEDNNTQKVKTNCEFYNAATKRVEKSFTIANTSNKTVTVNFALLLYSQCGDPKSCVKIDGSDGEFLPGASITEKIEAGAHKTVMFSFASESFSGEIVLVGGGGVVKIPFALSGENAWKASLKNPEGESRTLGFYKTDAQAILNGILFALIVVVFFFILNNQVLALFWPLVRRNFRAISGNADKEEEKDVLWTLFSSKINELEDQPRFSINPRAETTISAPTSLTNETSYLNTFFGILNWIFPNLGYSLKLSKVSSKTSGTGLSLSVIRNDRKENIAEKIFWAKEFGIDEPAQENPGEDLEVQKLLMIPAYFWFHNEVEKMDGFDHPPHEWESSAYYQLGNELWHLKLEKGIACYTNSINFNKQNWPAYAALGRVWIEKSQQQPREIAIESLLLANSYLSTAIRGIPSEENGRSYVQIHDVQIYFGALYNQVVALEYLFSLKWNKNGLKIRDLLLKGYKVKYAALMALMDIRTAILVKKEAKAILCADINSANWEDAKVKCDDLLTQTSADSKIAQFQPLKNPTFKWLSLFLPTLEFALQGLEAAEDGIAKDDMKTWLDGVIKQFTMLPFFDPPVDMDKFSPDNNIQDAHIPKLHFIQSHYRIQYNAACFYSQVSKLVPGKERSRFVDLALDHLVMALSIGGGLVQFAKHDSDLDPVRSHKRYEDLMPKDTNEKPSPSVAKNEDRMVTVYKSKDGKWIFKRYPSGISSKGYPNQIDATNEAKIFLEKHSGGELVIKGLNGRIRQKDTIAPAKDPRNIKG